MSQEKSALFYLGIYISLMVLLALSLGSAFLDLGRGNAIASLGIAVIKSVLVALFFMHLKASPGLTRVFALAGIFWLAVLFSLTLSDYDSRDWLALPGHWP